MGEVAASSASEGGQDQHASEPDQPEQTQPEADAPAAAEESEDKRQPKKKRSFWKELPILIVIALVLSFLIQTFVARVFVIPSGSMEATLHGCDNCNGDRILVDRLVYKVGDVEPGEVVVF